MADPEAAVPSVREMLRHQTLAPNVISRHETPNDIFDADNLAKLHRFVQDPSPEGKASYLRDYDCVDAVGDVPGTRAGQVRGSLVDLVVARHATDMATMTDEQIEKLRQWFEKERRY
ncbi:hypothetical protein K431DRAFT_293369 [Polychaeton citri CBS 116435]|uniref:Uncharacterized protein n=1 Tax=Polychaeton citri CBS 116435 TaxID=1314669 RepID=A0A9P4URX0_9PEZI|nr:hypothetical protein K431DRAFT_293369 [Polychaeton citri CBS 116435]